MSCIQLAGWIHHCSADLAHSPTPLAERVGKWPLRLGNAFNYASNLEEVAFFFALGSIGARCAELLVSSLLGCCNPVRGSVMEAGNFSEAEQLVGEKEGCR